MKLGKYGQNPENSSKTGQNQGKKWQYRVELGKNGGENVKIYKIKQNKADSVLIW